MTNELTFDPVELTITVGDTVTWTNISEMPHTATGDPEQNPLLKTQPELIQLPAGAEPWGSEILLEGDSFSHQFMTVGEFDYICIPHVLSEMRGVVHVE